MQRKIIKINEDLCNGCGECTVGCSEGALKIINGKAKLVRDDFCDGFGDCVKTCPTGALVIEEREADDFNEQMVKEHLLKTQGVDAVKKMEDAQKKHAHQHSSQKSGGCPGMQNISLKKTASKIETHNNSFTVSAIPSELSQWPVQLHLVNPMSDFLKNKELVILSTCSPVASADVHWKYLKGRAVVVACPKLDNVVPYVQKLSEIMKNANSSKVIVLRMQVPCCQGLTMIARGAKEKSGRSELIIEEHTMSLEGLIISIKEI